MSDSEREREDSASSKLWIADCYVTVKVIDQDRKVASRIRQSPCQITPCLGMNETTWYDGATSRSY